MSISLSEWLASLLQAPSSRVSVLTPLLEAIWSSGNHGLVEVLPLEREPTNPEDKCAVALKKRGGTDGHIPFNLAPAFLKRPLNKGLAEVTGNKVN